MADDTPSETEDTPPETGDKPDDIDKMKAALRKANKEAAEARNKLKELEDAGKSELDKLRDENTQLKHDLAESSTKALRLEIAAEKGVKPRWLTGTTREELEAAAEEYLADHPPVTGDKPAPAKPAEDLRGGGDPTEEPAVDIRKVVADIPRGF